MRAVFIAISMAALAWAQPVRYQLRAEKGNELSLAVAKTGLMSGKVHRFVFPAYQGQVVYDARHLSGSSVEFTVQTAQLSCLDTWVSDKERLKIEEYARTKMLAANRFPELRFRSTQVVAVGENRLRVLGLLTIREQTHPVEVMATLQPGTGRIQVEGTAPVKLSEFGLKAPSAALGTVGTKDEMQVSFRLRGVAR